jgi:predicted dehydrogenase
MPSLKRLNGNLKAVYSRSHASAAKLVAAAEKLGYAAGSVELYSDDTAGKRLDDLLKRSDIAGVVIALPITVQPDVCRKAFAAGKHVLMEKPIAKDVASAKELIVDYQKKYQPKGLVLSIAEQFRYMAAHDLARKWVAEDVGKLEQVHLRLWRDQQPSGKYYDTPWRKVPDYQGGFLVSFARPT